MLFLLMGRRQAVSHAGCQARVKPLETGRKPTVDWESRLRVLDELYRIFDGFINTRATACRRGCDSCCTSDVTLTTLEGLRLIQELEAAGDADWASRLQRFRSEQAFRPQLTVNQMAALCAADEPLPAETRAPGGGGCPLLQERACLAYNARPFACRCMVSRTVCRPDGQADMDELVVTVSNVFMQTIEHLDASGCSGNLADVLPLLADADSRRAYRFGRLDCERHDLLHNHPMTVLMIPPAHRSQVHPLLKAIRAIRLPARYC